MGLGLEQQHVAQALGIDATVISRHEKGRRGISEEAALRYAKYYGVPVDYILDGPAIVMPKHDKPVAKNVPESGIPKSRGQRLHDLRRGRGYVKLAPTARMIGVNPITMQHHEKGLREITRQAAEMYARFFGVPAGYILFGEDLPKTQYAHIVGYITAGGRVSAMPHSVTVREERRVPIAAAIPASTDAELKQDILAYLVQGDELFPAYFDGDVVLCSQGAGEISPLEVNGCECIVTTPSGEVLLRIVKPEGEGKYTIFGHNMPPQFGVRLVTAWPVVQINRGRARNIPQ